MPDDYTILDLETTGFSTNFSEIIEIGLLKVRNNEIVDKYQSLVKPNEEIDDFIVELTGISKNVLEVAPTISMVINQVRDFIGEDILMVHNANFDINFLYDVFEKYLNVELHNDFIDTLRISRKAFSEYPKHSLSYLCKTIPIQKQTLHRAISDCLVTFDLFNVCKNKILTNDIKLINHKKHSYFKPSDIIADNNENFNEESPLFGNECVFTGTLSQMTRSEAMKCIVNIGGTINNNITRKTKYLIMGCQDYSKFADGKESSKTKKVKKLLDDGQNIHVISEEEFYNIIFDMEK